MAEKVIVNGNLKELHSSGYEMRDGEPDIRGWKVKNDQNVVIGKVDELLFDTESLRVRYLILDLDGKPINLASRDVIIPIGLAVLDKGDNIVLLPEVNVGHLATLPEYKKGHLTIATEREVRHVFAPSEGVKYEDPDYYDPKEFYNNKYFDDQRMYRSRRADVDTTDETDDIVDNENDRERIIRTDEEKKNSRLDIDEDDSDDDISDLNDDVDDDVDEDDDDDLDLDDDNEAEDERQNEVKSENREQQENEKDMAPFKDGVIEITEHAEVPVVSKEPRVVEEISINKDVEEHDEKVKDSVRKNEVKVEKLDPNKNDD